MSYSSEVLADSPLAYWRLGEASGTSMADSSGNGRGGTYSGVTLGTTGLLAGDTDTAVTFPNSTSAISRVTSAAWMNVSQFSVEAIIKPASVAAASQGIVERDLDGGTTNSTWRLRLNGTKAELVLWTGTGLTLCTGATTLSAGSIYHLVGTYDGANMRIYVNGTLDATVAKTGTPNNVYDITIGKLGQSSGSQEPFNGVIDEAAVYGAALSGTRISAHYTASVTASASGSASLSLSASGSATAPAAGSASLSLSASGTATGGSASPASGAASLSLSASASATAALAASASLSLSASGSSAGGAAGAAALTLSAGGVAEALYKTDTSNFMSGRRRGGLGSLEVFTPYTPPAGTAPARVDKAVALPEPVLVDGRPT